jgi:predicted Zn-dependent protease
VLILPVLGLMSACLNGIKYDTDTATQRIAKAEEALERKEYRKVIQLLDSSKGIWSTEALKNKSLELVAIAHVRSGNVGEGVYILARLVKKPKNKPLTQARYAEAMFATGDRWRRWDARKILERLEQKDLMPDAESWAVLAAIRRAEKDDKGTERALARCRAISSDASLCPSVEPHS